MESKDVKKAIETVVKKDFLGKMVDFGDEDFATGGFEVKGFKVKQGKTLIPWDGWEDYGVDEYTEGFFEVCFFDTEDEESATEGLCCILTLSSKGQVGSAGVPCDHEWGEVSDSFAMRLAEDVGKIVY